MAEGKLTPIEKIVHEIARCRATAHAHSVIAKRSAHPESALKHRELESENNRFLRFLEDLLEAMK